MALNLSEVKEIVDLILTLIITGATVLLTVYTWRLVEETRKTRKEQIRPNISVYFEHAETDPTLMFIVIENNGKGTAYDLKFHIIKDIKDYGNGDGSGKIEKIGLFKHGMNYCPPGFIKKYFLIETINDYNKKMQEELHFTAYYKDVFKTSIKETFKIAIKEMSNWSTINPSPTYMGRIASSISEIYKLLNKYLIKE